MSIRAHRIKEIVYAENSTNFLSRGNLIAAIERHSSSNDKRDMEGGGILECTLLALKEILANAEKNKLEDYEIEGLTNEIANLEAEGKEDEDYIQYDMY